MKTLLLILGVVAFVYLDSGYSLKCHTCKMLSGVGILCPSVPCAEGLDQCNKNMTGMKIEWGCTTNCTSTLMTRYCCSTDNCNFI